MFGRSDDEWDILLDNAITILKKEAGRRGMTSYSKLNTELVRQTGQPAFEFSLERDRTAMGRLLGRVVEQTRAENGGMLSALVTYIDGTDPGPGFFKLATHLGLLPPSATKEDKFDVLVATGREIARLLRTATSSPLEYVTILVRAVSSFGQAPSAMSVPTWKVVTVNRCTRYSTEGVACTNVSGNADGWCRRPGCCGFTRPGIAGAPALRNAKFYGSAEEIAETGSRSIDIKGNPTTVKIWPQALRQFRFHHGGTNREADVQIRWMLADFLVSSGRTVSEANYLVLSREGYRLHIGPARNRITGYSTVHHERTWEQIKAGIPSRIGRITADPMPILPSREQVAAEPQFSKPATPAHWDVYQPPSQRRASDRTRTNIAPQPAVAYVAKAAKPVTEPGPPVKRPQLQPDLGREPAGTSEDTVNHSTAIAPPQLQTNALPTGLALQPSAAPEPIEAPILQPPRPSAAVMPEGRDWSADWAHESRASIYQLAVPAALAIGFAWHKRKRRGRRKYR